MATLRRKHRKRQSIKINFGFVIFGIIFIYMLIRIIASFNDKTVSIFQVEESSYDTDFTETGLCVRSEKLIQSDISGYVCYYIRDGEKVAKNSTVYSIDETGSMNDAIYDLQNQDGVLTASEYTDISNQIKMFKSGFNSSDFGEVYDFKYSLDNMVLELYNELAIEKLTEDESFDSTFSTSFANESGIVTYYKDGFEDLTTSDITSDDFDEGSYKKETLKTGDIITSGTDVYKLIDSENWQIVVKLTAEEYDRVIANNTVKFTINKSNNKITSSYTPLQKDGSNYIIIDLNRYMAQYSGERYIDVNFIFSETSGLKIPNSSILKKDALKIPISYLTGGNGSTNKIYFNQMKLDGDGNTTVEQVAPTIYFKDDQFVYIDGDSLNKDAVLVENDTNNTFPISSAEKYSMKGVYCVTHGTAVFTQINVVVEGDDYSIIEPDSSYGLSAYDRIVLDSSTVIENQVIY